MEGHSILLKEDNYAEWRDQMGNYLCNEGLWSIVTSSEASGQKDWKDKNLKALHVIWNSCGERAFSMAKRFDSARLVWNCLAEKFAMLNSISKDNFLRWSLRMKCYSMARDLWSVVDVGQEDNEFSKEWKITNLEALQVIRRFCDWEALSEISECGTAREAWNVLVTKYDVEDGIKADGDNYAHWSDKVKSSLMDQGLWDIIEQSTESTGVESLKVCFTRHSKAIKVIRTSCGWEAFSIIQEVKEAQKAWDILAERYGARDRINKGRDLVDAVQKGDWAAAEKCLGRDPYQKRCKITSREETALHIAVTEGQTEIVKKLVEQMSRKDLETRDVQGFTALARAAIGGIRPMAECMLRKNEKLIFLEDAKRRIPVVLAIQYKHKDLALYLYKKTPQEVLKQCKGIHGATVCTNAIDHEMLDIALDLVNTHPPLALAIDLDGRSPLYALASMNNAFSRVNQPVFWKRWICFVYYHCFRGSSNLSESQSTSAVEETLVNISSEEVQNNGPESQSTSAVDETGVDGTSERVQSNGSGDTHLEETNLSCQAHALLQHICKQISISTNEDRETGLVFATLNLATREGMSEFISEILNSNYGLRWTVDGNGETILCYAVRHRQDKIFRVVLKSREKDVMINSVDTKKNSILHVAGMLPPSTRLDVIPGAALQMQNELRWFKKVENIAPPIMREARNKDDLTPMQLFTKSHGKLRKEGEKWMKETATFGTVIVTLVIAVVFAATITTPGGYNQETGWPMLLNKNLFKIYVVCNSISLVSSSTSVLMFLSILTSRYEEEDFLKCLPVKMMIALFALSLSVAVMMLGFCCALALVLNGQPAFFIPIIGLVGLPLMLFITIQVRLVINMSRSTFRSIA